jgi:steroid 5-alpha reductase family enzyme
MTLTALLAEAAAAETGLAAMMAVAWGVHRLTGASGWIDAIWTFGVGAVGVGLALGFFGLSGGEAWRAVMVAALAAFWSLRLAAHIVARTLKVGDDPRYAKLVKDWGDAAPLRLFAFLQVQAVAGAILSFSIGLAASAAGATARVQDMLGVVLFAAALFGEAAADAQIARFKADRANRDRICDVGLWRLSRHPNYFFEWLTWVAFAILALGANWTGWLALFAPALMYWTLRFASGVPLLEEHMLASRGDLYRAYQATTPVFFPKLWPPLR